MSRLVFFLLAFIFAVGLCVGCGNDKEPEQKTVKIAAAASLEKVFEEELIPAFAKKNPDIKIEGVYDSSGKLQMQIENGLDTDLFFSAAEKQMQILQKKGFINSEKMVPLLENKLVLIVNKNSNAGINDFAELGNVNRPAIGDPESVPAGQYAKEALQKIGVWDKVIAKASLGTNVTEVLYWVAEGSADAGIVYATDAAVNKNVAVAAKLPDGILQKEVIYPLAVLQKSAEKPEAVKFYEFLQSQEAAQIFKNRGFEIAGEVHEK